jgi:hypothetical protein
MIYFSDECLRGSWLKDEIKQPDITMTAVTRIPVSQCTQTDFKPCADFEAAGKTAKTNVYHVICIYI